MQHSAVGNGWKIGPGLERQMLMIKGPQAGEHKADRNRT